MSGFAFAAHCDPRPIDPVLLERVQAQLLFRGRDGSRTWSGPGIGMAAATLRSTTDSDPEEQPLSFDGRTWIVGDVRLDDRRGLLDGLRASAPGRQAPADSAPDLTLILHAYRAWQFSCVGHLRGDFAFAVWDGDAETLFCARDHFGIASLYYALTDDAVIGGNTLQAILAHGAVGSELDERAVGDHLLFGYHADVTATVYAAVRRLAPGHALRWDRRAAARPRPEVWRYWSPRGRIDPRPRRPQEYVDAFRYHFGRAVQDRLRTDRVATHLSGGLDSSSVTATAHALLRASGAPFDLRAYTIEYVRLVGDEEGRYADLVSGALGIERESVPAEDFIERVPEEAPTWTPPEPGTPFAVLAEIEIQRRAVAHTRVLLQSFGGDPALYPRHRHWLDRLSRAQLLGIVGDVRQCRALGIRPPLYVQWMARRWSGGRSPAPRFPSGFQSDFATRTDLAARFREFVARAATADHRAEMAVAPLWSHVFAWADPGFTGLPLRSRFPFFAVELVDYLMTVPPLPWFVNKTLLREAMKDVLPEAVRRRPKTPLAANLFERRPTRANPVSRRLELARVPGLAAYVDPDWLARSLRDPPVIQTDRALSGRALALAWWLRQRS